MKKRKVRSCIMSIFILILAVLFMSSGCSVTTANVTNAVMTTNVDENFMPVDEVTSFPLSSDIYVAAELHNAPDDTTITFVWYVSGQELDKVTIGNDGVADAPLAGYLPAELVNRPGNYKVEIYIDDRDEPDTVNEFTVQ